MSKKFVRSIAAVSAALVMSTQAMAFSASAAQDYYYYYNGVFYSDANEATEAAGGNSAAYSAVLSSQIPSSAKKKYHDPETNKNYDTREEALVYCDEPQEIFVGAYSINTNYYSYGKGYYCSLNGNYYATYSEALTAAGNQPKYVTYVGTSAVPNRYYSSYTGLYYSTYQAALDASRGNSSYVTYMGGDYWYGYYGYGQYYSSYTGKYYNSYSAAVSASNGNSAYVSYVGGYYDGYYDGYYYSSYTGKYYSTYSAALNASKGNTSYVSYVGKYYGGYYYSSYTGKYYDTYSEAVTASNGNATYVTSVGYGKYTYKYYYNGVGYTTLKAAQQAGGTVGVDIYYAPAYTGYYGYGYNDPYYVLRNELKNDTTTTTSKEAEDGEPYIYGKKTKAGWSTIIKYINAASKGDNIKVDMNGAKVISKDVLSALDGKNVSVTFVLDSGVKWTINGKDVDKAQDMVIYTEYNIDFIPDKLVSKAAKGAVSKAEIGISNNYDSFGSEASVTVKFSTKRAGCTAVIYRYNPDTNSLKGVDKAKVQSNGSCTFSVTAGGPYLIVLK